MFIQDEIYYADYNRNAIMAINKYQESQNITRRTVKSNVAMVTDLKVFTQATQIGKGLFIVLFIY